MIHEQRRSRSSPPAIIVHDGIDAVQLVQKAWVWLRFLLYPPPGEVNVARLLRVYLFPHGPSSSPLPQLYFSADEMLVSRPPRFHHPFLSCPSFPSTTVIGIGFL